MAAHGPNGPASAQTGRLAPTRLLVAAGSLGEAVASAEAGADLVDLTGLTDDAAAAVIREFRGRCPGVGICAAGPGADLVRDPEVALATGALLICASPAAVEISGLPASQVIVEVPLGEVAETVRAGWATLVDADDAARPGPGGAGEDEAGADETGSLGELAGVVAAAALGSWLGAALVRTRHVRPVRRGLDMAASIRGTRPPARTLRGLA